MLIISNNLATCVEDRLCRSIVIGEYDCGDAEVFVIVMKIEHVFHDRSLKPIDGLFIISDDEYVWLIESLEQFRHDGVLESIGVLIFIHHDKLILLTKSCDKVLVGIHFVHHHPDHVVVIVESLFFQSSFILLVYIGKFELFVESGFFIVVFWFSVTRLLVLVFLLVVELVVVIELSHCRLNPGSKIVRRDSLPLECRDDTDRCS